jgi:hypothetical protein
MGIFRGPGGTGDATGDATNQASIAIAAANTATSAATSALNSATNAANLYDEFDDRYLGAKTSDPTLDNDGNALITGALYFNTVSDRTKVYDGTSWDFVALDAGILAAPNGSSLIGFQQNGTGAVTTNVENKLKDTVSVKDFGAIGNGVTDDRLAFQAAIDFGRPVYIPAGVYAINGSLLIPNNTRIFADVGFSNKDTTDFRGGVKLVFSGTGTGCFVNKTSGSSVSNFHIYGFTIIASGTFDWVFNFDGMRSSTFNTITSTNQNINGGIFNCVGVGDPNWINYWQNVEFSLSDAHQQYLVQHNFSDSFINQCYFTGGRGILDFGSGGNLYTNTHFDRIFDPLYPALDLKRTGAGNIKRNSITNCYFDVISSFAIRLDASNATANNTNYFPTIVGCVFRTNTAIADIKFQANENFTVVGGIVSGCSMTGGVTPSFDFDNNWFGAVITGNNNVVGSIPVRQCSFDKTNGMSLRTARPVTILPSGKTLIGSDTVFDVGVTNTPLLTVSAISSNESKATLAGFSSMSNDSTTWNFVRSKSGVLNQLGGAVTTDTGIGDLAFRGDDGVSTNTVVGAQMQVLVQSGVSTGIIPTDFVFRNQADGDTLLRENFRIKSLRTIRLPRRDNNPPASEEGDVYFNTVAKTIRFFNGTSWIDL